MVARKRLLIDRAMPSRASEVSMFAKETPETKVKDVVRSCLP